MDCQRARDLVGAHMRFLATLEGEKVAEKKEIIDAFRHIKCCSDNTCLKYWNAILRASMELEALFDGLGAQGWDGEY